MRTKSEQRAEAEALFTSIGEGAITTDEFGRITRVNPPALDILGYKESELLGEWFPKVIVAVTSEEQPINLIDRSITKAFLTGRSISEKVYYRHKNGHPVPLQVSVSPIIFKGKPLGAIEVFRDITLEQQIDRMKSEFISLASHQLRTPLSAIKTYSHMLSDGYMGELNATQKKATETIISSSNRMNELISTLLNVTRLESGKIITRPKLVEINKLIAEVMPELELMAAQGGLKISLNSTGKYSPEIKTDTLIVKEAVNNLVSNAIKYTPKGGSIDILIKLRKNDVLVSVKDTGWGIPKYAQDQVFSKFFRAQNIVKKETTGTGLGLYMVRGLLASLGSNIWFESHESSGTTFYFDLQRNYFD